MSLLRHAVRDILRPTVKSFAGVSVLYRSIVDGTTYPSSGVIIATVGNSATGEDITEENFVFTNKSKDFKIDVVDFHRHVPHAPQERDLIIVVDGLGLPDQWYQVLSAGGDRAVGPLGNFEDTYLIQTKHVPNTDASQRVSYGNAAGIAYGSADPNGTAHGPSRRI